MSAAADALRRVGDEVARALRGVDRNQFDVLCDVLTRPKRTWFFTGQGRSGLVACMAAMRFMHLGWTTHVLGEATAPSVRKGDGLVVISKSGRTPASCAFARTARDESAYIVLVTGDPDSPLAALAGCSVCLPCGVSQQFGGSLFEQTALSLLDASILAISGAAPDAYARMTYRHTNMQ